MTTRRKYGEFKLTEFDIESYAKLVESSKQIGERLGVSGSLVSYHLRKLNDPRVNKALEINSNQSRIQLVRDKQPQIEQMIRDGVTSIEIIEVMKVSPRTLVKIRSYMKVDGKKKEPNQPPKPKPKKNTVIESALSHTATKLLTKSFIVKQN